MYARRKNHRAFLWLSIILMGSITSCLPKQEVLRPQTERPTGDRNSGSSRSRAGTSPVGWQYIEKYQHIAIEEMSRHGIPASIKLAQGILESGNGTSRLAVEANNHFGIKCTSDWSGGRSYHDDDAKNDCFRVYSRVEESFRDHSQFLLRRRYENLFNLDPRDYRGWANGLKAAGYATNPRYADLLIDLIERYELHLFDTPDSRPRIAQSSRVPAVARAEGIASEISSSKPAATETISKPAVTMKIHEVTAGETLAAIASRYGLSTQEILQINGLRSGDLHPGQLLVVSKM